MITQSDLINLVSKNTKISKEAVRKVLRQYLKFVLLALENGECVRSNLGTFDSQHINQKFVHNFQTGERFLMHPKKKIMFNPSRIMKHSLDKLNADLLTEYDKKANLPNEK